MSTSIVYHIFGTKGYKYQSFKVDKGEIRFAIIKNSNLRCPACKSTNVIKRGSKVRSIRAIPIGHYRKVFFDVTIHKIECKDCGKRMQEEIPIIPSPKARHTKVFKFRGHLT